MKMKLRSAQVWAVLPQKHRWPFFVIAISVALLFPPFSRAAGNTANDVFSSAESENSPRNVEQDSTKADKKPSRQSRFTNLDGARIHYVNYGKGDDAIVLIHGWTMNVDNWRDQIPDFAKQHRVIAIDLPGHGQSDKPKVAYSMEYFARAVEAVYASCES